MPNDTPNLPPLHPARTYQTRIGGRLSANWAEWFDGPSITHTENDETLLTGLVADQAALQGLFKKIRDLGLPLLSVNPVEPNAPREGDAAHDPTPKE